ncbi:MAG: hypothetical protein ACOYM3_14115 [Terrimicrobiaceae bacterium]
MAGHRKSRALRGLWLLTLLTSSLEARESPLPVRTTSSSGQFVIYSKDAMRRTSIAQRAEDARAQWLQKTGSDGNWSHVIIIQDLIGSAKPRGNPEARTAIFEGDEGSLKVQTDIYDASVLRGLGFEMETYRALGIEWIYRTHPLKAGKSFRSPPAWLLEGLVEEKRVKEHGTPDAVYNALLKSDRPPKIEDFLKAKPELMEATSLALYRTQALALVKTLTQLPEGPKGLGVFLGSLAENESDIKSLFAAYPSLQNDPSRLGKLWTLSIARGSASKGTEPLSVGETARALKELLDLSAPLDSKKPDAGKVTGAAALPLLARAEGGPYLMRQKSAEFLSLEFRAHPLLKPVIAEYRKMTTLLADKPKKNVDKPIEENGKILDLLLQRTGQVSDYLNWFEATQLDTLSENFLEITSPPETPKRTDPISLHLDAIEERGW